MSIRACTRHGVITIEIARPEKKNALTLAMYDAMAQALSAASSDPAVRAVLIAGQPGAFTAGNDLQDFLERPPASEDSPVYRFMRALSTFEKPVIAAVTGLAVGIGVTMLLHCDLVYVSDDAKLSTPFVNLGLCPEFASSLLLPRLVGPTKAFEILVLGTPFSGTEAATLGIANAALPAADVLGHAHTMAERFNALPPDAVRDSKRLLRAPLRESVEQTLRQEATLFIERIKSPEAQQALGAFLNKRKS